MLSWPNPQMLCQHQQIAIRVLHKDLLLAMLALTNLPPNLPWSEIEGPTSCREA